MPTLQIKGVGKTYDGDVPVVALRDVNLRIEQGEYVAIEGPSGSGKSTLLNQLALLDTPTVGEYTIDGHSTTGLSESERARMRSDVFAFIFQSFHLLESRRVVDNVAMGMLYRGLSQSEREKRAVQSLEFVGLAHKANQRASKLSGGERQRVAIARAIASGAPVVVADEPTGNLDSRASVGVMETLEQLNARGTTVIIVTHDKEVAARASRRLWVFDGEVSDHTPDCEQGGPLPSGPRATIPLEDVPSVPGRSSKVRLADAVADAWAGLWAKPSRTLALVASVLLGVGLALATIGLTQTASAQVSNIFDAQRNQWVGLTSPSFAGEETISRDATSLESWQRLRDLEGVTDVMVVANHERVPVTTSATVVASQDGPASPVMGLVGGQIPARLLRVQTPDDQPLSQLEVGSALVGARLAADLKLGPLKAHPVIWVAGEPKEVVGIITDAGLQLALLESVMVREEDAALVKTPSFATAQIRVQPGAAQQVAGQAPFAWTPTDPRRVSVDAPPDPKTLRGQIESNLATMLLTLTAVTLLASVLMLTNSMTTAVFQRVGEFGLRRAIGARKIHIIGLVMQESLTIGALGGIGGAYAATLTVLITTIIKGWQPVFDLKLVPLGILGGIVVGLIGGLIATFRASRIQPSDALRAE